PPWRTPAPPPPQPARSSSLQASCDVRRLGTDGPDCTCRTSPRPRGLRPREKPAKGLPRGGHPMLQVGDVAPDFELLDENGKPTRLSSFRGRNVVLVFFPAAFSPICTQELRQISSHDAEYDRLGASVIGISVDNKWSLKAFKHDEGLTATLLSDFHPKGNV